MFDTAQILKGKEYDVPYVSSCLLHFSLFWVSVLGSVSELMTGKPPYMTKKHKSQSSSRNHRAIAQIFIHFIWLSGILIGELFPSFPIQTDRSCTHGQFTDLL